MKTTLKQTISSLISNRDLHFSDKEILETIEYLVDRLFLPKSIFKVEKMIKEMTDYERS